MKTEIILILNISIALLLVYPSIARAKKKSNVKVNRSDFKAYDMQIKQYLLDSEKNKAIKYLRKETGIDLKEAYDYVTAVEECRVEAVRMENSVEENLDSVRALIQSGEKIKAIKEYRNVTGAGLKEASDAVDQMIRTKNQ